MHEGSFIEGASDIEDQGSSFRLSGGQSIRDWTGDGDYRDWYTGDWDGVLLIANVDVCHSVGVVAAIGSGDGGDGGWNSWDGRRGAGGVLETGGGTRWTGGAWETETVYTGAYGILHTGGTGKAVGGVLDDTGGTRTGTVGMVGGVWETGGTGTKVGGVLETGGGTRWTGGAWETETVYTGAYGMGVASKHASVTSSCRPSEFSWYGRSKFSWSLLQRSRRLASKSSSR